MKRRVLLALLVAVTVVSAGCLGGTSGGNSGEVTAEGLKNETKKALGEVNTYRVKSEVQRQTLGNSINRTVSINSDIGVDRQNKEMKINKTVAAMGRKIKQRTYIVDKTQYKTNPTIKQRYSSNWIKANIGENFTQIWGAFDTVTRQRAMLNISDAELVGEGNINGVPVHILKLSPDIEKFREQVQKQTQKLTGQRNSKSEVQNVTLKLWVSKNTTRPKKIVLKTNTTTTFRGQELTVKEKATLEFVSFNSDLSIELPKKAKNAVNVTKNT